jgi:flagellar capping protein FliD
MGDEEPATKADLNSLVSRMDAMMAAIESQKSQLDALTNGTSSTTPPTPVVTPDKDKPSLNEDDPDKDGDESNEDPPKKDDTPRGHSTEIPHRTSYVSG